MMTESLKGTMMTVDAMKSASKELKSQYGKMNLSKIEDMHDEMQDLMEQAEEVQEIMGRSYGVPEDIDDDVLEAGGAFFLYFIELAMLGDELDFEEAPAYLNTTLPADMPAISHLEPELPADPLKKDANPVKLL